MGLKKAMVDRMKSRHQMAGLLLQADPEGMKVLEWADPEGMKVLTLGEKEEGGRTKLQGLGCR